MEVRGHECRVSCRERASQTLAWEKTIRAFDIRQAGKLRRFRDRPRVDARQHARRDRIAGGGPAAVQLRGGRDAPLAATGWPCRLRRPAGVYRIALWPCPVLLAEDVGCHAC